MLEDLQRMSRAYLDGEISATEYHQQLVLRMAVKNADVTALNALAYQLTLADHAASP